MFPQPIGNCSSTFNSDNGPSHIYVVWPRLKLKSCSQSINRKKRTNLWYF